MAQYNKILAQFTRLNYFETSQLQQYQIDKALDSISYSNTGISQFDRQVSEELWEHTPKQSSNTVYLRDYIHSILEAQKILKDQIGGIEDELKQAKDQRRKQQLMGDLYSYSQDHRILTAPFNIEQVRESVAMQQSRAMYNQSNAQARMRESSGIFDHVPSQSTKSWSLKIALLLTIVLAIVQLIVMFHKHHFYSITVYLFIFSIFFLNYFDRWYMKFVLINILLSILLDFAWLLGLAGAYWNPYAETQHSTIQDGFLKFIIIFVIFCMAGRVVLLLLFFRYRDNSEDLKKTVQFFGLKFSLDGKPRGNPIASMITGTRY